MDKLVILIYFVWMFYEFGQGICVCMLTTLLTISMDVLETLEFGFVDMSYDFFYA